MYPEDSAALPHGVKLRAVLLPVIICAVLSVVLMRSGFLSFLFLVPLGYTAAAYNPAAGWFAFTAAAVLNGVFSLGFSFFYPGGLGINLLFYTVTALGFTWIMAGGPAGSGGRFPIRTMYRFIAAAAAGAVTFLAVILVTRNDQDLTALVRSQAELLSSLYVDAAGQALTPETLLEAVTVVAFRGGALVSAFSLFFISRQAALTLAWLFRRRRSAASMSGFHVPANTIWVLSGTLPVIILAHVFKLEIPEIAAWNALMVCVILFLAQGGGIALYHLTRRVLPPFVRLLCNVLIVIVIFSPGINMLTLGGLVLLGIAENWLPLRAPESDGSASTPGL